MNTFFSFLILATICVYNKVTNYETIQWTTFTTLLTNKTVQSIDLYENDNIASVYCSDHHIIKHYNLNNTESSIYRDQCFTSLEAYTSNYKLYFSKHHSFEDLLNNYVKDNQLNSDNISLNYQISYLDYWIYLIKLTGAILILLSLFSFSGSQSLTASMTQSPGKLFNQDSLKTDFQDIIGLTDTKHELQQYIDYLRDRQRYLKFGVNIPRGLLFLGPPGCGKTLLAKAVAKRAKVNFIQVTGSDFQEMFVGVGAARMKHLFNMARINKPCILFIDEIDSLGRKRDNSSYNSESNSVLNKFLVEMDGFENNDNILVIAATNRSNVLDPAMLRSGRFDRKLVFDIPNKEERILLYRHYLKGKPISPSLVIVNDKVEWNGEGERRENKNENENENENKNKEHGEITDIAKRSAGLTGSDINTICNQAGIICLRKGGKVISKQYLYEALEEITVGNIKKERLLSKEELTRVAYHEAGHCLISYCLKEANCPIQVSIIPRGEAALGYSMSEPDDKRLYTKPELLAKIAVLYGGRIAEMHQFKTISTGASDDLEKASALAYNMINRYGFGRSLITLIDNQDNKCDTYHNNTFKEVSKILESMHTLALNIIQDHEVEFGNLAELLLKDEVIDDKKIEKCLGNLKNSRLVTT